MTNLKVGDLSAQAGEKVQGYLTPGLDDQEQNTLMRFPVVLISGVKEGPTLAITAGTHGGEYSGVEAVLRLIELIEPQELSGNLILSPCLNTMPFFSRTIYVNPIDGLNLNRLFPGDPLGKPSERLAHVVTETIIGNADYYIDLHSGDINEDLLNFVFYTPVGDVENDQKSLALASQFPSDYVLATGTEGATMTGAKKKKVPSILTESGGRGRCAEDEVDFQLTGLRNVLTFLGMYSGGEVQPEKKVASSSFLSSEHKGYLRIFPSVGTEVQKDEFVGDIRDDFGANIAEIKAPASGILFFKVDSLPISQGEPLLGVLIPNEGGEQNE